MYLVETHEGTPLAEALCFLEALAIAKGYRACRIVRVEDGALLYERRPAGRTVPERRRRAA